MPSLEGRKVLTLKDNMGSSAFYKGTTTPTCGNFDYAKESSMSKDIFQDDQGDNLNRSVPSPGTGNCP